MHFFCVHWNCLNENVFARENRPWIDLPVITILILEYFILNNYYAKIFHCSFPHIMTEWHYVCTDKIIMIFFKIMEAKSNMDRWPLMVTCFFSLIHQITLEKNVTLLKQECVSVAKQQLKLGGGLVGDPSKSLCSPDAQKVNYWHWGDRRR